MKQLYSHRSQLVLGFHGCDASLAEQVVLGQTMLSGSKNRPLILSRELD